MPGLGSKSYIQTGVAESAYGTFRIPTKKLEVISWSVAPVVGVIQDPNLYSAQSRRALHQGGLLYKGSFVVRINYEGMLELFRGVFGSGTSTTVETGVRDHVFIEGATLNSYSFEVIHGDIPTGKVWRLTGCKLIGLTVKGTAGTGNDAMLQAEFTVLAKDYLSDQTITSSLSFPSLYPVLFHQSTTVDDGTADTPYLRSFEVTLENPHAEDRFYFGATTILEPIRSDFLTARWKLTQEFNTKTSLDAAKAFTVGSPQLVFRHPTLAGATAYREFELKSGSAILTEASAPIEGFGPLIQTTTWEAYYTVADTSALVARFRNTEAALT